MHPRRDWVRKDGTKRVLAVENGYRESKQSWLFVLRMLAKRGMNSPVLAIGDGALGVLGSRTGDMARHEAPALLRRQAQERPRQQDWLRWKTTSSYHGTGVATDHGR